MPKNDEIINTDAFDKLNKTEDLQIPKTPGDLLSKKIESKSSLPSKQIESKSNLPPKQVESKSSLPSAVHNELYPNIKYDSDDECKTQVSNGSCNSSLSSISSKASSKASSKSSSKSLKYKSGFDSPYSKNDSSLINKQDLSHDKDINSGIIPSKFKQEIPREPINYNSIFSYALIGIKMFESFITITLTKRVKWIDITGYADELERRRAEIVKILTEIDPFKSLPKGITSPYMKLLFVLLIPLIFVLFTNYMLYRTNKSNQNNSSNSNSNINQNRNQNNNKYTSQNVNKNNAKNDSQNDSQNISLNNSQVKDKATALSLGSKLCTSKSTSPVSFIKTNASFNFGKKKTSLNKMDTFYVK